MGGWGGGGRKGGVGGVREGGGREKGREVGGRWREGGSSRRLIKPCSTKFTLNCNTTRHVYMYQWTV